MNESAAHKAETGGTELLTIEEVAIRVRRSPATIRWWVHTQTELGPLFGKFGRRRMARATDVDQWVMDALDGAAR